MVTGIDPICVMGLEGDRHLVSDCSLLHSVPLGRGRKILLNCLAEFPQIILSGAVFVLRKCNLQVSGKVQSHHCCAFTLAPAPPSSTPLAPCEHSSTRFPCGPLKEGSPAQRVLYRHVNASSASFFMRLVG